MTCRNCHRPDCEAAVFAVDTHDPAAALSVALAAMACHRAARDHARRVAVAMRRRAHDAEAVLARWYVPGLEWPIVDWAADDEAAGWEQ